MKKNILSMFCLLLLTSSFLNAQNDSDKKGMSLDKQLVFVLNEANINETKSTYVVDISNLEFKSSKILNDFCANFSFDFHTLKGDYKSRKIIMTLDKTILVDKKYTVKKVNDYFNSVSRRMQYAHNQLNQN